MLQITLNPAQKNITFSGRKVPLKNYKGPLLRDIWSPEEKAEIERLQKEIVELDTSLLKQDIRYNGYRARTWATERYENYGSRVTDRIEALRDQIEEIAKNCMNRYREQHKKV